MKPKPRSAPKAGATGMPASRLTGAYQKAVKLTFARGASTEDRSHLFNSSLESNTRRAIDIHEGEEVDAGAFKTLVKAAVARNGSPAKKR